MIFDKQSFTRNAEPHIKKLIPVTHIDLLDGMAVEFDNDPRFGTITHYEVDGEEFYLYPVCQEWCVDGEQMNQMSLFGNGDSNSWTWRCYGEHC